MKSFTRILCFLSELLQFARGRDAHAAEFREEETSLKSEVRENLNSSRFVAYNFIVFSHSPRRMSPAKNMS